MIALQDAEDLSHLEACSLQEVDEIVQVVADIFQPLGLRRVDSFPLHEQMWRNTHSDT